jgi:hypothetical protein
MPVPRTPDTTTFSLNMQQNILHSGLLTLITTLPLRILLRQLLTHGTLQGTPCMRQIVPIHFPSPTQSSNLQLVPIFLALATTRHTNKNISLEAPLPSHWTTRFPNGTAPTSKLAPTSPSPLDTNTNKQRPQTTHHQPYSSEADSSKYNTLPQWRPIPNPPSAQGTYSQPHDPAPTPRTLR